MTIDNTNSKLLERIHGKDSERNVVLVVEDCATARMYLGRIVPKVLPGYSVEFANNGCEAIGRICSELMEKVAIIITDIEMRPINGLEMAKNLKRDNEDPSILKDMKDVPILVNSSNEKFAIPGTEEAAAWQELSDAGIVDSFERKPFGCESIRDGVYRAICSVQARIFGEAGRVEILD